MWECPDLSARAQIWLSKSSRPCTHLMSPRANVLARSEEAILERLGHDVFDRRVGHGEQRDDVREQLLVLNWLLHLRVRVLEGLKVRTKELERLGHARHRAERKRSWEGEVNRYAYHRFARP